MDHKTLVKVQVPVSALQLGMYVCELDRPWADSPFLFQGFPLNTEQELASVRAHCRFVYIDETRSTHIAPIRHTTIAPSARPDFERHTHLKPSAKAAYELHSHLEPEARPIELELLDVNSIIGSVSVAQEVEKAALIHSQGKALITSVFADLMAGRDLQVEQCRAFVRDAVMSIFRNENALIWYTRLKSIDEYTALHCLSVSILATGFARHLGHSEKEMELIGLAGLLHDVGKMQVDQRILNKPSSLTAAEFDIIKQHARLGYEYLQAQAAPTLATITAYMHHERLDGRGYPRGVKAEEIPYEARLIAVVDCYDAVTSHRVYGHARSTNEAFKVLMDNRDKHFDGELVEQFIQWIGVYPVGSLVELNSGEVGVVVATNSNARLRPEVIVLRNANKEATAPRYLDLAKVNENQMVKTVKRSHPDGTFDIDLSHFEDSRLMRDIIGQGAIGQGAVSNSLRGGSGVTRDR